MTHLSRNESNAAIPSCCRVCGGVSGSGFNANGFEWFRCETCGTTQKLLTREQFQALNPTYDPGDYLDSRNREQIEGFLNIGGATKVLADVIDKYLGGTGDGSASKSFLDVGCGMGMYLIAAQRLGFEILGFEPSLNHAQVAMRHLQLPVVNEYFSADRVNGKKFDLIMLSHVIEHIYDPKSFVHELVGVLKPGGALIVITPNNDSLLARTIGKSWPMLKPVDHVSMIGANAYQYFNLGGMTEVHHSSSEYPFEFAASALAAVKSFVARSSRNRSTNQVPPTKSAAPPLRKLGVKAKLLRYGLSAISAPMHAAAIATRRQACLKSVVIRRT